MRVIAGALRGRPLKAPAGDATRPTGARVKEALFSILADVTQLRVLDPPRIRGALGIEALGTTWNIHTGRGTQDAKRGAGATFGEVELGLTSLLYLQARAGVLIARYTLPSERDGMTLERGLGAGGFAQLAVPLVP